MNLPRMSKAERDAWHFPTDEQLLNRVRSAIDEAKAERAVRPALFALLSKTVMELEREASRRAGENSPTIDAMLNRPSLKVATDKLWEFINQAKQVPAMRRELLKIGVRLVAELSSEIK